MPPKHVHHWIYQGEQTTPDGTIYVAYLCECGERKTEVERPE